MRQSKEINKILLDLGLLPPETSSTLIELKLLSPDEAVDDDNWELNFFQLRFKIEKTVSALYRYYDYTNNDHEAINSVLITLISLLLKFPTRGLHSQHHLLIILCELKNETHTLLTQPKSHEATLKKYANYSQLIRALANRTLRALSNMTDSSIVSTGIIALLYLTWIFPLLRLSLNIFFIALFILKKQTLSETEKKLSWPVLLNDQLKRNWHILLHDSVWIPFRMASCFLPLFRTFPQPISLMLFIFATIKAYFIEKIENDFYNINIHHENPIIQKAFQQAKNDVIPFLTHQKWGWFILTISAMISLVGASMNLFSSKKSEGKIAVGIGSWTIVTATLFLMFKEFTKKNPYALTPTVFKNNDSKIFISTDANAEIPRFYAV